MRMFNNLCGKSGSSVVGMVVGMGVLGVMSVALISFNDTSISISNKFSQGFDQNILLGDIKHVLVNPELCMKNFGLVQKTITPTTKFLKLETTNKTLFSETGTANSLYKLGEVQLELKSQQLLKTDVVTSNKVLSLDVNLKSKTLDNRPLKDRSVGSLFVMVDNSGKILSCTLDNLSAATECAAGQVKISQGADKPAECKTIAELVGGLCPANKIISTSASGVECIDMPPPPAAAAANNNNSNTTSYNNNVTNLNNVSNQNVTNNTTNLETSNQNSNSSAAAAAQQGAAGGYCTPYSAGDSQCGTAGCGPTPKCPSRWTFYGGAGSGFSCPAGSDSVLGSGDPQNGGAPTSFHCASRNVASAESSGGSSHNSGASAPASPPPSGGACTPYPKSDSKCANAGCGPSPGCPSTWIFYGDGGDGYRCPAGQSYVLGSGDPQNGGAPTSYYCK